VFSNDHLAFYCPVCTKGLPDREPDDGMKVNCPACGTALEYDVKYFWIYQIICAAGAILIAYKQKLAGPMFVLAGLLYYAVFFFGGARYLPPVFPLCVKASDSRFTTLGIDKYH
jgi:hypothetical protein